jgi:WD40 repeat protein
LSASQQSRIKPNSLPNVDSVAFSPHGSTLATGDSGGTAYLWNLAGQTHTVISEPGTVWAVAFSKSGILAVGDADGSTYLRAAATGDYMATLTDPASGSQGVGGRVQPRQPAAGGRGH